MPLEDTDWQDEPAGFAYRWDIDFGFDQDKNWDGRETVWIDDEDA